MPDIVITEFMDEDAVDRMTAKYDCVYDPALVDEPDRLTSLVTTARALVVRNRTQVRKLSKVTGRRQTLDIRGS